MTTAEKKQQARRAVSGRRAVQVNGVLVPVKTEVPRAECVCQCGRITRRPPDAEGRRKCYKCDPLRKRVEVDRRKLPSPKRKDKPLPRLMKGRVWRLCIKCDRKVQRFPDERGPFFCFRCRDVAKMNGTFRADIPREGRADTSPERAARLESLATMYAAVKKYKTESEARAAGLVTTVDELPYPTTEANGDEPDASDDEGEW